MADEPNPTLPVLPAVTHVELVRVQPGDVLACSCSRYLSDEEHELLTRNLSGLFPGVRVAILEGGMKLAVVRADDEARPATDIRQG